MMLSRKSRQISGIVAVCTFFLVGCGGGYRESTKASSTVPRAQSPGSGAFAGRDNNAYYRNGPARDEESPPPPSPSPASDQPPDSPLESTGISTRPPQIMADRRGPNKQNVPPPPPPPPPPTSKRPPTSGTPQDGHTPTVSGQDVAAPLLIYQAWLELSTFEISKKINEVEKIAKDSFGFLESRKDTSITIRVPATKFEATLTALSKLGDELHRDIQVEDVSEQFSNLAIRLQNLKQVRDRMQELLDKAKTVSDALAIQRELAKLNESIRVIEGKMRSFKDRALFSTIRVTFIQKRKEHIAPIHVRAPFSWMNFLGLEPLMNLHSH
jgi:cell division protein ZapA (FtsZ GTPase activity inhibitor)